MYQRLGFSLPRILTPPKGVRDLLKGVAGAVFQGTMVTIPTPIGPQTFNLGDPAQVAQIMAMLRGTRVSVATPRPGTGGGINQAVQQNVPGGWATIGLVALAGFFLLGRSVRTRRA